MGRVAKYEVEVPRHSKRQKAINSAPQLWFSVKETNDQLGCIPVDERIAMLADGRLRRVRMRRDGVGDVIDMVSREDIERVLLAVPIPPPRKDLTPGANHTDPEDDGGPDIS